MTDFSQFVPEHVRKLAESGASRPLKQSGGSSLRSSGTDRRTGEKPEIVHLNLNENPFGPSPRALEALSRVKTEIHRYPEIQADGLHEEIAAFHSVRREQVLVTAGATELLCMMARALLGPGLTAITSARSFIVYKLATQVTEGKLVEVPTRENGYDLAGISKAIDSNTRIVFIANPNNPTGTLLTANEIDAFIERLPDHVLLVLDEAYGDFAEAFAQQRGTAYSNAANYIRADKNVILLKTFSKAHGLAGLEDRIWNRTRAIGVSACADASDFLCIFGSAGGSCCGIAGRGARSAGSGEQYRAGRNTFYEIAGTRLPRSADLGEFYLLGCEAGCVGIRGATAGRRRHRATAGNVGRAEFNPCEYRNA